MRVKRSQLVALLQFFGAHGAENWDLPKLTKRVNETGGVARYAEPADQVPDDKDLAEFYAAVRADQEAGNLLEIEDDSSAEPETFSLTDGIETETETETVPPNGKEKKVKTKKASPKKKAPKKKAPVAKKTFAVSTDPNLTWKQRLAGWAKNPYQLTNRGAGVVRTIVDLLKEAGKKNKPITKDQIWAALKKKFSDRDPVKMMKTVNNQVPTQLGQYRGIHVWVDDSGPKRAYFIKGDGATPQKKSEIKKAPPSEEKDKTPKKASKKKATAGAEK